jgi:hypothetical protein
VTADAVVAAAVLDIVVVVVAVDVADVVGA